MGSVCGAGRVELDRGATGVAVIANGYWPAKQGRDVLAVEWQKPAELADTGRITAEFHRLLSHPAIMLRVIPEDAFCKGARSLPGPLQFPH